MVSPIRGIDRHSCQSGQQPIASIQTILNAKQCARTAQAQQRRRGQVNMEYNAP
jgi:hypothetical protein